MMLPLIVRLCAVGLAICGLVLLFATLAVHQQPLEHALLQGLDQCGRPCWAGIKPGRTALAQVPALVAARHPGRRSGQMASSGGYSVTENDRWINIAGQGSVVTSVELTMPLELWRLILLYGAPTCLKPLDSVTILYWVFGDSEIVANFVPVGDDWRSHTLVLQAGAGDPCYQRDDRQPWRGWAAF